MLGTKSIATEYALLWGIEDLIYDKSILVQVIDQCHPGFAK